MLRHRWPNNDSCWDTYDANADGKGTKEEFTGEADTFALLDKDGDGVIQPAELGLPADYRPRPSLKPSDEPAPGAGRSGNVQERLERFRKMIAEWDADKDGKVTKEEYKGKLPFDVLDRNKDGVLSKYEVKVQGVITFNGNEREVSRTHTIVVKEVGSTKVTVPEEAARKL